jgi:hypothetical protein
MTAPTTQQQIAWLRQNGYTGAFGGGAAQRWLNANPTKLTAFNAFLNPQSTPLPTQTPTQPPDPNDPFQSGGVVPVGFVEPFNDWQKQGLEALTVPQSSGNDMFNLATTALSGVPADINASRAPLSGDVVNQRTNEYMNPYLDQVLGRTVSNLNDAAAKARASLMASQGFRKAFGDTSLGVQQSELDKNLMDSIGNATANISFGAANDASNKAISTLTNERDRALSTAGAGGNLSGLAINLANMLDSRTLADIKNKLGAGTAVQSQNQRLLDVLNPEISGTQNYDLTNLQNLSHFLAAFPGSTMQNSFTDSPNMASRVGNAASYLGGIDWSKVFS